MAVISEPVNLLKDQRSYQRNPSTLLFSLINFSWKEVPTFSCQNTISVTQAEPKEEKSWGEFCKADKILRLRMFKHGDKCTY